MQVSPESIRTLRARTGAGIMDCKKALEAADGDLDKAESALRLQGMAHAASKSDRVTAEGVVDCYVHAGKRVAAMVEINCETDFVARTSDFTELAHNRAMQVAAMAPVYVDADQMPADDARLPEEVCLLKQSYIKDPSMTIGELVLDLRARVGENIRVSRFTRFTLGE